MRNLGPKIYKSVIMVLMIITSCYGIFSMLQFPSPYVMAAPNTQPDSFVCGHLYDLELMNYNKISEHSHVLLVRSCQYCGYTEYRFFSMSSSLNRKNYPSHWTPLTIDELSVYGLNDTKDSKWNK